ncbi:hypothetical protein OsI_06563 [Oryza sativa Indica Group]|uniref:RING-type E3 ubiquitin transferase n=1 Tax=Oryza sativa subsp. indica TaxID=39946 RepID=B8AEZ1_ORYSI|nr:hypothetical protein OsI_06563 [Oryza sativa Indica Group]
MLLVNLYSRLTASTGVVGVDDDDDGSGGYGVLDGACGGTLAVFCVLAVSVVVWKACAFVAMAAALLAIGWRVVAPPRRVGRVGAGASTPECGLTAAAIDALPASEYERPLGVGGGGDPACSVCLEDVRGGETVRRLPACGHLYHAACIDAWLRSRTTCPLCRSDLYPRRGGTASGRARPRLMTHESLLPPLPSV